MSVSYRIAIGAALSLPLAAVFGWQALSGKLNPSTRVQASSLSKPTESVAVSTATLKSAPQAPATQPITAPIAAHLIQLKNASEGRPTELAADALFAQASPAVVRVIAQNGELGGKQGSGFFISSAGVLVTNYHVIRGAEFASIIREDETTIFVEGVIAQDPKADLAILKLNLTNVPFLTLNGPTIPRVGTKVFAIGNPDGLTNTLSEGLISGIRDKMGRLPSIQTTAAISHGSSGGPLLTTDGSVVGVTTAMITEGQNLNFAVPASQINDLLSSNQSFQKLSSAGLAPLEPADTRAYTKAYRLIVARDYPGAAKQIELVRPTQQNNPYFWITRGLLHEQLNNETVSIESFRQAQRLSPGLEAAWYYNGESYLRFSRYPEATEAFFNAIKVKPQDARAYMALGWIYHRTHRLDRCEQSFRRATEIEPNNPDGYNALSCLYVEEQRYPSAISLSKKAIALNVDYAPGYLSLGTAYYRLRQYSEAQMAWQTAARIDPAGITGRTAATLLQRLQAAQISR